jgi:hypothetical protein
VTLKNLVFLIDSEVESASNALAASLEADAEREAVSDSVALAAIPSLEESAKLGASVVVLITAAISGEQDWSAATGQ